MKYKKNDNEYIYKAVELSLRIGFLGLLIIWCFNILSPLLITIAWGGVIAVGFYPLHLKVTKMLRGRERVSATCISVFGIVCLIFLTIFFINIITENIQRAVNIIDRGKIDIPLPYEKLVSIPIIGEELYEGLDFVTDNIEDVFEKLKPQIKP